MTFVDIEAEIDRCEAEANGRGPGHSPTPISERLLNAGERVLEEWIRARDQEPTPDNREGFRLLALHRQGAKGESSFNACRETCRELCYHYNLITMDPNHADTDARLRMAVLVTRHLYLFVSGKMQVESLGEFCCSSRPVRSNDAIATVDPNHQLTQDVSSP